MTKRKLQRFNELTSFSHVVQPPFDEVFNRDYQLKGRWKKDFFKNDNPLVLELGCGKGEYTVALASRFPDKNFLGIDIKGARIWAGAKQCVDIGLTNAAFLRTRVEFINSFFAAGEIDEIWITFPDPQLKKNRYKKRLTGPEFLTRYRSFLAEGGLVHLKTDSAFLYSFTKETLVHNRLKIYIDTDDLYASENVGEILSVQTYYESIFLKQGLPITYLQFSLDGPDQITDVPDFDDRWLAQHPPLNEN